jgi:tetratricopeptide (TPR) repeat protein
MSSGADGIRASIKRRDAVLFCGAGISMEPPATLPDWNTFRDETIRAVASVDDRLSGLTSKLVNQELIAPERRGLAPEVVASQTRMVAPDYFSCLAALDHDDWNRNHALIAHCARRGLITQIITTNFDQLIEKALRSLGVTFRVYRSDDDFTQRAEEGRVAGVEVFKLHGCLSDPDTIVATVEQEAVGLSLPKAAVLRQIWPEKTALFWGYSGADLKVAEDYLYVAESAPSMRHVFWNLHATPSWQEEPLPELRRLIASIPGTGSIEHCDMVAILSEVLQLDAAGLGVSSAESSAEVRHRRSAELTDSIQSWAKKSLRPEQSAEICGRLFERIGEPLTALTCYELLSAIAVNESGEASRAFQALAGTRRAALLCQMGMLDSADEVRRVTRDAVVGIGSVDLLITLAQVNAQICSLRGDFLGSVQSRAFAHRISRWASPAGKSAALELSLDTARELFSRGLIKEAQAALGVLDEQARDAGFLEIRSRALALRSRIHGALGELRDAMECGREAEDIVVALGLKSDAKLLRFHRSLLEFRSKQRISDIGPQELAEIKARSGLLNPKVVGDASELAEALAEAAEAENRLVAAEVALDAFDILEPDREKALAILARLTEWAGQVGVRDIHVRAAFHKALIYRSLGDDGSELEAIEDILADLQRPGYGGYAEELYERYAFLKQRAGVSPEEALRYFETAISFTREQGFSRNLENEAARIKTALGITKDTNAYAQFITDWVGDGPLRDELVAFLLSEYATDQEVINDPVAFLAEALESGYGEAGSRTYSLIRGSFVCESARRGGDAEHALEIALQSLPMARTLADPYLVGVLHNQAGLDLADLDRWTEALRHFKLAVDAAQQTNDDRRLIHYLFNLGSANADLDRYEAALEHYEHLLDVVRRRQDFAAFQRVSLAIGEALKALGRMDEAESPFEYAHYCAWIINDTDLLVLTSQQLGKVYREGRKYERSIAERHRCMEWFERQGDVRGMVASALLIANIYDKDLGRALDAIPYYGQVLGFIRDPDATLPDIVKRLRQFEGNPASIQPWLHALIVTHVDSVEAADAVAVSLALHMGFDLWHYELRSWAAWTERHMPPVVVGRAMITLGKGARAVREPDRALAMFELAKGLTGLLPDFEGHDSLEAEARGEIAATRPSPPAVRSL